MQRTKLAIGVLLGLVGAVWLGQGLGIVPGSFMTGSQFWAIAGIVALVVGIYLVWGSIRQR
jgi:uncharacterized membrane protein